MENMVKNNFWENKTVLITGMTGFVGSNLASRLVSLGAKVIGIVRDEIPESNFCRLGLEKSVTVVRGDLQDPTLVERTINEYTVQIIYHLAAQTIVGTANRSPVSTFQSNIQGTWNLLEACRGKSHIQAVVAASSDKAYGSHKILPYQENFALQPEYPYDTSKACADLIVQCYHKTYGVPVVITRFANIYGPGDINFSRIIPDAIQSIQQGKAPIIRSDGTPERDYLYVDDVVDLYLLLAEKMEKTKGEIFNAGHNKPISVLDLVKTILKITGREDLKPQILGKGSLPGEINRQWLDGSKVKRVLNWEPKVKLEEGLQKTLEWYKSGRAASANAACRICGSSNLALILSLGKLPLANALLKAEQLRDSEPRFLLDFVLCPNCSLLQITETVPPELLFSNYSYFSSFSDTMLRHAKSMAEDLKESLKLNSKSLVVEVASNDGYLLQFFKEMKIPVLGIEPAANIASVAESKSIPTLNAFFDNKVAEKLSREGKKADLIIGNNVLAHVAHLHEFVDGVRILLKDDGVAVFETVYARDTIQQCQFDQIYHEHLCYYSLTALKHLFDLHDLQIVDTEVLTIHGGSLRIYVKKKNQHTSAPRMLALLESEEVWGVKNKEAYSLFCVQFAAKRKALLDLLHKLKSAGHRIAGYGAAAKGSIMLNAFGIGPDLLDYVVDRSPYKRGLYMPGCHLPIYAPEKLLEDKPPYTLMLTWNFKDEVLEQQAAYRKAGGKFIIPIPIVEIV